MRDRLYIYPNSKRKRNSVDIGGSPYIAYLSKSLQKYFEVVNAGKATKIGLFDLLRYLFRMDIVVFNWIENVPDKRGGYIQAALFYLLHIFFHMRHIRVVWIMHNKLSHEKKNIRLKRGLTRFLLRKSDVIITHASEGIHYARSAFGVEPARIHFVHHPFFSEFVNSKPVEATSDILIWGKIVPYKGVDQFLKYLHEKNLQDKYTILLAGQVYPQEYMHDISRLLNHRIRIENRFIPDDELEDYIRQTKLVLFTYRTESILSSGSLMESLVFGKPIIGPHSGAFQDLSEEGIVFTFREYDELINTIDSILNGLVNFETSKLERFIQQNTWSAFARRLNTWIAANH